MEKKYSQALKTIEFLETECNIYSLEVGGIPMWWFIRYKFFLSLLEEGGNKKIEPVSRYSGITKEIAGSIQKIGIFGLRSLKGFIALASNSNKKPVWLLAYSSDLKKAKGKPAEDINIDSVYQKVKNEAIIIAMPSLKPRDIASLSRHGNFFFDAFLVLALAKIFPFFKKKPMVVHWEEFERKCNSLPFGEGHSKRICSRISDLMRTSYPKAAVQIEAARIAVDKLRPEVIVETSSYDSGIMAINFVAKEKGVKVIELQHGIITDTHGGYIYFLPEKFRNKRILPDKLFVNGSVYKDTILHSGNGYPSGNIIVSGNMRMQKFLRQNAVKRDLIKNKVRKALNIGMNDFMVTVSSQPLLRDGFVKILQGVLSASGEDVCLCIKPHPMETDCRQVYETVLANSKTRLVTDEDFDLYEILIASDVHVTLTSTVFIECLALGVPNIIVDGPNLDDIAVFLRHCRISPVATPEAFVAEINKLRSDPVYKSETVKNGLSCAKGFFADIDCPEDLIIDGIFELRPDEKPIVEGINYEKL